MFLRAGEADAREIDGAVAVAEVEELLVSALPAGGDDGFGFDADGLGGDDDALDGNEMADEGGVEVSELGRRLVGDDLELEVGALLAQHAGVLGVEIFDGFFEDCLDFVGALLNELVEAEVEALDVVDFDLDDVVLLGGVLPDLVPVDEAVHVGEFAEEACGLFLGVRLGVFGEPSGVS